MGESRQHIPDAACELFLGKPWADPELLHDDGSHVAMVWALLQCADVLDGSPFGELLVWLVDGFHRNSIEEFKEWVGICLDELRCNVQPCVGNWDSVVGYWKRHPEVVAIGILALDSHVLFGHLDKWRQDFLLRVLVPKRVQPGNASASTIRSLLCGAGLPYLAAIHCIEEGDPATAIELIRATSKREIASKFLGMRKTAKSYLQLGAVLVEFRYYREAEQLIAILVKAKAFSEDLVKTYINNVSSLRHSCQFIISLVSAIRKQSSWNVDTDCVAPLLLSRILHDCSVDSQTRSSARRSRSKSLQDGRRSLGALSELADPRWCEKNVEDAVETWLLLGSHTATRCMGQSLDLQDVQLALMILGSWGRRRLMTLLLEDPSLMKRDEARVETVLSDARPWYYEGRDCNYFGQSALRRQTVVVVQLFRGCLDNLFALSVAEGKLLDSRGEMTGLLELQHFAQKVCGGITAGRDSRQLALLANLMPLGGPLRACLAEDIRESLHLRIGTRTVEQMLGHLGFFHESFQEFIRDRDSINVVRLREGRSLLFEATVKLLSLQIGTVLQVRHGVSELCDETDGGAEADSCYELLLAEMVRRVVECPLADLLGDVDDREGDMFNFEKLVECGRWIRQTVRSWTNDATMSVRRTLEQLAKSFLLSPPTAWLPLIKSLDSVFYCLKYLDKEDLTQAYQQFALENGVPRDHALSAQPSRWTIEWLIDAARSLYNKPLLELDGSRTVEKLAKESVWGLIMQAAPASDEWSILVQVAAAAAESMQDQVGVLTLPHHTQMITLVMFSLLVSESCSGETRYTRPKSMVAQVGTGEGKSWIIAMLAAYVALKGRRAHILVDSTALLERDYAALTPMFKKLGLSVSKSSRDLTRRDTQIVYCKRNGLISSAMTHMKSGHQAAFDDAFLIVDEIDGLIIDGDPNTDFADFNLERSNQVNAWLDQADGDPTKLDANRMPDADVVYFKKLVSTYKQALRKEEGVDYIVQGDQVYALDAKTKAVLEVNEYVDLWLELKRREVNPSYRVQIYSKQTVVNVQQCFNSYAHIFGLTGSLGRQPERSFIESTYGAILFRVPPFLNTCTTVRGKQCPIHIAKDRMLQPNKEAQLSSVIDLAVRKCASVPVLIIVEDRAVVSQVASKLRGSLPDIYKNEQGVLELLPTGQGAEDFAEGVDLATRPLTSVGQRNQWRISVTTAEGGRGHDYRVSDSRVDEKGGLLVIVTWVPWSEREWAQFRGRTARQDRAGQYAVILDGSDRRFANLPKNLDGPKLMEAMFERGDRATEKTLAETRKDSQVGRMMHEMSAAFYTAPQALRENALGQWSRLCDQYLNMTLSEIEQAFEAMQLTGPLDSPMRSSSKMSAGCKFSSEVSPSGNGSRVLSQKKRGASSSDVNGSLKHDAPPPRPTKTL
eukprot:TRINITY_DN3151_c0_g3_i1.p1 TRINITY_DN3151_c0_g3~~TRINITY_DN3151_c0_g3_i1.p1  ORF type:complete len:1490 (-),score=174.43 TRINITY_DN3151_c0_g3_i1:209-4426(-)